MIGIYKITSPNNRVYIGQSVNIEKRFVTYKKYSNNNKQPRLFASFKKYGCENHIFEILEECEIKELNTKERYYQDIFNCIDTNGLNCRLTKHFGKSGKLSKETRIKIGLSKIGNKNRVGMKHSEEVKKRMSDVKKGKFVSLETKNKQSLVGKGRKNSEETIKKMSMAKKGKVCSQEHRLKISIARKKSLYTGKTILNKDTGIFYFGSLEASKVIGINQGTLKSYLNGNSPNKTQFIYV